MAVTKTTTIAALAGNLIVDFAANASSENNVTGNSSGVFYLIDIDNTGNTSSFAYVKIRDASSATPNDQTAGVPTWQFAAPPGTKISYVFPDGQEYSAGLSMWCVTSTAQGNISAPSNSVVVKLVST